MAPDGGNGSALHEKGNKVAVSGSVQLRNYEDNQGVKRTAVDIIVQDVEFLTPKGAAIPSMTRPRLLPVPQLPPLKRSPSSRAWTTTAIFPFVFKGKIT